MPISSSKEFYEVAALIVPGTLENQRSGTSGMVHLFRVAGSRPGWRVATWIGSAGLLAGLVSFGLGEMIYGFFRPEAVPQPLGGGQVMRPTLETVARAASRNAALTFGIMGGVLGLALGLTGGLIRRSIGSASKGGLVGLF